MFMREVYGQPAIDALHMLKAAGAGFTREEIVRKRISYLDRAKVAETFIRDNK